MNTIRGREVVFGASPGFREVSRTGVGQLLGQGAHLSLGSDSGSRLGRASSSCATGFDCVMCRSLMFSSIRPSVRQSKPGLRRLARADITDPFRTSAARSPLGLNSCYLLTPLHFCFVLHSSRRRRASRDAQSALPLQKGPKVILPPVLVPLNLPQPRMLGQHHRTRYTRQREPATHRRQVRPQPSAPPQPG